MSKDPERDALVDAIIGNIRTLPDFDEALDEVANMTEDEWAALEAEFDALPQVELTSEDEAWCEKQGKQIAAYIAYLLGMQARGLTPIDIWEWNNMAVKPTVPEEL